MKTHLENLIEIESNLTMSVNELLEDESKISGFLKLVQLKQYVIDQIEILKYFNGFNVKEKSKNINSINCCDYFCCPACQNEG